jgi:hypothetical protein
MAADPHATRELRRGRRRPRSGRTLDGVIQHPGFAVDPWAIRETTLDLDTLAQTESLFALANGTPRAAGESRRGRAVWPTWHVPRRVLRNPAAAARRARLRRSGRRANRRQHHERQDPPTIDRGRAVRRPLWRAAQARADPRSPRGHAASHRRVGIADRAARPDLITNEAQPTIEKDPRGAAALTAPLASEAFYGQDLQAILLHTTKVSSSQWARRWTT